MEWGSQKDFFHRRWQKAPSKQDDEKLKVLAGQQGSLMDMHITHEDGLPSIHLFSWGEPRKNNFVC